MKKINVAFYSPSSPQNNYLRFSYLFVNPTPFYLHGYFRKKYPEYEKFVNWTTSILLPKTTDELLEFLETNDIDILCLSLYLWNSNHIINSVKDIKKKYSKKLFIVAGGPSAKSLSQDWQEKYDFIDKIVVGQGEKAWAEIILDHLGVKSLSIDTNNIIHLIKKDSNISKNYNYEFIRDIHYSPYLECADLVKNIINEYKGYELSWPYETQRGCPYHCTFCDWNGGQSNKTQKRKEVDFLKEIDFFAENKMYSIHISDANFGMWDVDVEIMKRFIEHKKNGHPFSFFSYNLSKKINDNFIKIIEMIVEYNFNKVWLKLSAQDVHKNVLDAIDRPGDWEELKKIGLNLYKKYSKTKNLNTIVIELILGLPEQTVNSFIETLDEVYSNGFMSRSYPFLILDNAPVGYDTDYIKKYGIKTDYVIEVTENPLKGDSIIEVFNNVDNRPAHHQIIECNTFNSYDLVKMSIIDQLYRKLLVNRNWSMYEFIDLNWKYLKPILVKLIDSEDFQYLLDKRYENFQKYKINGADSAEGKLMINGSDVCSIIGRNIDQIENYLNQTDINSEHKDQLLNYWKKFTGFKALLDR